MHRLSDMENNLHANGADADQVLRELSADRANLSERMRAPRWFAPAFGTIAALYAAMPSIPNDGGRDFVFVGAVVASIALCAAYYRATGVKASGLGARGWFLGVVGLLGILVCLSVSFGLAAAGLHWWIALSALAAFAWAAIIATLMSSGMQQRVRDVR